MKFGNFLIFLTLFVASAVDAQKKMVCYWYVGIDVSQIDATICTHIIYSFLGLDSSGALTYSGRSQAQTESFLSSLVSFKSQNPALQVIATVGGYNEALVPVWSAMAASSSARSNFAQNILTFLQRNNLNGIDIDWEYPNFDGESPNDVQNYNLLLQDLKRSLGSTYTVSTAIGAGPYRTDLSYDIPTIFQSVDFVNVMTYDLHGSWESVTGIHTALYPGPYDQSTNNVDHSIQLLLNLGAATNKLIMGMATYGNAFILQNAQNNGVGAPASGAADLKYSQICQFINTGQYSPQWEATQRVAYAFGGNNWVGYDNIDSITEKGNYINQYNLGGGMFWAIDDDDYLNACGTGRFPLISTAYRIVVGGSSIPDPTNPPTNPPTEGPIFIPTVPPFTEITTSSTTTTSPPTTVTTTTTSTSPPTTVTTTTTSTSPPTTVSANPTTISPTSTTGSNQNFVCPSDGLFRHPTDCTKFFSCFYGTAYEFQCQLNLYFNEIGQYCDYPYNVQCS